VCAIRPIYAVVKYIQVSLLAQELSSSLQADTNAGKYLGVEFDAVFVKLLDVIGTVERKELLSWLA
jgi:hypothetical protein